VSDGGVRCDGAREHTLRMMRTPRDPAYLRDLFSRNARTYDPVNRVISLGQIARWRGALVRRLDIQPDDRVLDAFSGPAGLGLLAFRRLGPGGRLVIADVSPVMLREARRRVRSAVTRAHPRDAGPSLAFRAVDLTRAGSLVFWGNRDRRAAQPADDVRGPFDCVLVGFGLRYVSDPVLALSTLGSLLRPGGRMGILEFTVPAVPGLARALWYLPHAYFARVLPVLASGLAGDREIYDYLSQSSKGFLTEAELLDRVRLARLSPVSAATRMGGLVSIIVAVRGLSI
jgi:demethylmenaquinone methyltransferase / 2-methoxy-6-polyprenyl-1,4-benzoquinol methylase